MMNTRPTTPGAAEALKDSRAPCPSCEEGWLSPDMRDVSINRRGYEAIVPLVAGLFCDSCDEIDFDQSTDSGQRYADTGDLLVLAARAQAQACL